jgi:hypothetical protein
VDHPDFEDAARPALGEVLGEKFPEIPRVEGVQIELRTDGKRNDVAGVGRWEVGVHGKNGKGTGFLRSP